MSFDTGSPDDETSSSSANAIEAVERRGVATAVGAFLVLGVGFVFTLFFVGRFSGDGSAFSGGVLGASGLGLAVVLSPLLAVVVGVMLGRDDSDRAVREAGVGSALGFVVMYFVTLVIAASLQSSGGAAGTGSVGPLAGFTVGVGLTGAAAAAVTQTDVDLPEGVVQSSYGRPAVFGALSFLVFAAGYAVSVFLASSLASTERGIGLFSGSVAAAVGIGLVLSPLLAVVVGILVGRDTDGDETAAAAVGGVSTAVGAGALVVVLYLAVMLLEPEGMAAGDFPFGPLVGFVVGAGLTGAGGAYVGGR